MGGLGMHMECRYAIRCLQDSFNFLYGLIPSVHQVIFSGLCSPEVGSLQMAIKDLIAL